MLRSFRREVLRSLYWQQRTKFPSITLLPESEAVCTAVIFLIILNYTHVLQRIIIDLHVSCLATAVSHS
jgi:hypothetical protein